MEINDVKHATLYCRNSLHHNPGPAFFSNVGLMCMCLFGWLCMLGCRLSFSQTVALRAELIYHPRLCFSTCAHFVLFCFNFYLLYTAVVWMDFSPFFLLFKCKTEGQTKHLFQPVVLDRWISGK